MFITASVAGVLFAAGCSDGSKESADGMSANPSTQTRTAAQLDESGLIASVGAPIAHEYKLNDGKGISFRPETCNGRVCGPDFSIEFRDRRINVAWENLSDSSGQRTAELDAMNAENLVWAGRVLTYALGDEAANSILKSAKNEQPITNGVFLGKKVGMSSGFGQTLVQIFP